MLFEKSTTMPSIYVLFGYPIKFTLSPIIHNAIFKNDNENSIYFAQPVAKGNLEQAIKSMKMLNWSGANVTIPYKQSIIKCLDKLDDSALKVGAVNTILNKENKLIGFNTDVLGFKQTLPKELNKKGEIVCMGAGGAALAIVSALTDLHFNKITIVNRTQKNSDILIKRVKNFSSQISLTSVSWQEIKPSDLCNKEMVINCTPVDFPLPDYILKSDILNNVKCVYDLRYGLENNKLLQLAKQKGVKFIFDGLAMLIWQALYAQMIWRGVLPDPNTVKEVLAEWI